ncbi:hypothetical protein MBLNU230_g2355t1 [Neophaeotheca triangularis]
MSSSFEKSVKGGTKVKAAPPKSKYVEHILQATQSGEAGVADVFRSLTGRLRDSTWTVAFKALIIVHLMIKEGVQDVTLSYLSAAPANRLAMNSFTDVQTQGHNIRRYSDYLVARARAFASTQCDFVRSGEGRMRRLTVDKGLLRETEVIQDQIRVLVKCDLLDNESENEISLMAFRLLTKDLLDLYAVQNEAVMNVLSHYFEMSRPDAERAISIYSRFCKQTDQVVKFLAVARQYEHATRLEIPKIKHAPTSLAASLQEYLDDQDFDNNRQKYLAEQSGKKPGAGMSKPSQPAKPQQPVTSPSAVAPPPGPPPSQSQSQAPAKGPAPDLIDFFDSIEQNQQPMAHNAQQFQQQQQQQQPTGFGNAFQAPQQTGMQFPQQQTMDGQSNPFGQPQQQFQQPQQQMPQQQQQMPQQLQMQPTGAGFGGYGPQPQQQAFPTGNAFAQQPQQSQPQFTQDPMQNGAGYQQPQPMQSQQTGANPFRKSSMPIGLSPQQSQRQSTNPFARNQQPQPEQQQPQQQQPQQSFSPLQAQPTGTNPFARPSPHNSPPPAQQGQSMLQPQATGTNPFRQSVFVNQATGSGWQNSQQPTMGGFELGGGTEVFPRPGQAAQGQGMQGIQAQATGMQGMGMGQQQQGMGQFGAQGMQPQMTGQQGMGMGMGMGMQGFEQQQPQQAFGGQGQAMHGQYGQFGQQGQQPWG